MEKIYISWDITKLATAFRLENNWVLHKTTLYLLILTVDLTPNRLENGSLTYTFTKINLDDM